jgi:hypothetical protein
MGFEVDVRLDVAYDGFMPRPIASMTVFVRETNLQGFPYASNTSVDVQTADVVAFAKQSVWGCKSPVFWVRVQDGREFVVKANRQSADVEKWLRSIAKNVRALYVNRSTCWAFNWVDVA